MHTPTHPSNLVEIIILKDEIHHDIDHDTYLLDRIRQQHATASGGSAAGTTSIATDDTSRYILNRYIDRYVSMATTRLSPYMRIPSQHAHRIAANHTRDWKERSIYLSFPPRWPAHLLDPLRDAVHKLIVKGTEKDYLSYILGPSDPLVTLLIQETDDADADITALANTRLGPMATPMTFGE